MREKHATTVADKYIITTVLKGILSRAEHKLFRLASCKFTVETPHLRCWDLLQTFLPTVACSSWPLQPVGHAQWRKLLWITLWTSYLCASFCSCSNVLFSATSSCLMQRVTFCEQSALNLPSRHITVSMRCWMRYRGFRRRRCSRCRDCSFGQAGNLNENLTGWAEQQS